VSLFLRAEIKSRRKYAEANWKTRVDFQSS